MNTQEVERVRVWLTTPFDTKEWRCPVSNPVPEGAYASTVPKDLRWLLCMIVVERTILNESTMKRVHFPFYTVGKMIMEAEARLLRELRARTGLDEDAIVEFHEGWTYSVTSLQTIRTEYAKREQPPNEVEKTSGLCFAYRNQLPEVAHFDLWAHRKK